MNPRRIWLLGLLGLLVCGAVAIVLTVPSIQDELESDAAEALDRAGYGDVDVSASGRTLVVGPATPMQAVQLLEQLDGVRNVDIDGDSTDATVAPTTTTPPTSGPTTVAPTTAPDTTAMTTTTVPSTTTAPTTTVPTTTTTSPPTLGEQVAALAAEVRFEPDDLTEPTVESKELLDQVAALLLENPDVTIDVVGHLSTGAGDDDDSLARAWAVAGYLEFRGIPFERQAVSGVGDTQPLDDVEPNDPLNDRIEIRVNGA